VNYSFWYCCHQLFHDPLSSTFRDCSHLQ
jgi:hypothetical protein